MSEQHFLLPDYLTDFVQTQVAEGGFAGVGDYYVQLIATERQRKALAKLEETLLDRINSEPKIEMTADDWAAIRQEGERRLRESGRL